MEQETVAGIRATLEEELRGIDRQLAELRAGEGGDELALAVDEGFADSAQATAERAELLGLLEQLTGTRAEVAGALERMEAGTYGRCERCGQQIPAERLEALPTARLCISCKQAGAA